jgi:phage terminase Nu1 subunit (DNA packaging protein)
MVREEIYLLTKHANFSAEYVEKIPVHDRRHFLHLLREEMETMKEQHEKQMSKTKVNTVKGIRRR